MLVTQKTVDNGDVVTISFKRESWKELFTFRVSGECRNVALKIPYKKMYVMTGEEWSRDMDIYWLFIFVPFVKAIQTWWKMGRFFNRKGYLNVGEGTKPFWFWPIYLRLKKKNAYIIKPTKQ